MHQGVQEKQKNCLKNRFENALAILIFWKASVSIIVFAVNENV